MDRQEVWEHVVHALEREFTSGEFGDGEFHVQHNDAMRTVHIIETHTSRALALMNVTGSTFSGGHAFMDELISVHVPLTPIR